MSGQGGDTKHGSAKAILTAVAATLLVVGCGSGSVPGPPPPVPTRLNVVVLMTDDQTNSDLRVMPRTRRLIESQGVKFTRFYTSYPLCCPSRTTFLTGQYAHNTGVQGNFPDTDGGGYLQLRRPRQTLPVWLRSTGYETAIVGKWPEFPPPGVPPGWDRWWTMTEPTIAHYYDYSLNGFEGGTRSYGSRSRDYNTSVLTRIASRFITSSARRKRRFFLWVSYTAPHFGFGRQDRASRRCGSVPAPGVAAGQTAVPAPRDVAAFTGADLPRPASFNEPDMADKPPFLQRHRLGPDEIREMTTDYRCRLASLLAVDRSVAETVRTLRRTGQLDHTLIVFTSDNGFMLGQHREAVGKNLPYEDAIRVPLLVRGPGIPTGEEVSSPTANVDLAPTILAATTGRNPKAHRRPADGRSLIPIMRGNPDGDRAVLIEGRDDAAPLGPATFQAVSYEGVRTSRYLYVEWHRVITATFTEAASAPVGAGPTVGTELYDMRRDPYQLVNKANAERYRPARRKLAAILGRLLNCVGPACVLDARIPSP